ncbi:MAG TPA: GTPase HflX [Bryobacteraceae bacterium]|nr:GTPase HflX [Bryobacteraceae bacterium]
MDYSAEESLEELATLVRGAGAQIAGTILQSRERIEGATLIGSGKVEEAAGQARAAGADLAVFDHDLTPTQQRNLERAFDCRVVDRTQVILDIFARRAHTREGQLQVELAQLNYLLPRLTGRGVEMSRLGGGIGTRGPGETQLETDRRRISARIRKIGQDLDTVRSSRAVQRRQRQAVPLATAALAGYTNAGKSSIFNRLTGAAVLADARMFATLDPTVRALVLPSRRRLLLSDTVGFIRNLPVDLVKAFRATLEEVTEAALVLHVVDVSSPHAEHQIQQVLRVLAEIGAGSTAQLLVLNKVDMAPVEAQPEALRRRILAGVESKIETRAVAVSARTGLGMDRLLQAIDEMLPFDPVSTATFRVPAGDGATIHLIHQLGRVLEQRYEGRLCVLEAEAPQSLRQRLAKFVGAR